MKPIRRLTVLSLLAALALGSITSAQDALEGRWIPESPGVFGFTAINPWAWDGTSLYLTDSINFVRYDPVANVATPLARLPQQFSYGPTVHLDGAIYVFGSILYPPIPGAPPRIENRVARYSIAADAWTLLSLSTEAHGYGHSAVALGGKIYVAGGTLPFPARRSDAFSEFDPVDGRLTALPPLPARVTYHVSFADPVNGRIYVAGGSTQAVDGTYGMSAAVYEYKVAARKWTRKGDIRVDGQPYAHVNATAFQADGRYFIAGGVRIDPATGTAGYLRSCLEYRPGSDDWIRRTDMSRPRSRSAVASYGGEVLLVGGSDGVYGSDIDLSRERFIP